ncbi:MAG: hypothetical protein EGP82_01900 [Odoribacter splanchnicus]|nr:hypothetical protein [Odoribacter splanchnicus]
MRRIKNLTVKVTYTVGLGGVEVEDEEYESLMKAYDEYYGEVPNPDECCCSNDTKELSPASKWLSENIKETDAMDWNYEIQDIED